METYHGDARYWTTFFEDRADGCAGYKLHRRLSGKSAVVAQTVFWDAVGEFCFSTIDGEDIPVAIVEAAIAEAKKEIKVR